MRRLVALLVLILFWFLDMFAGEQITETSDCGSSGCKATMVALILSLAAGVLLGMYWLSRSGLGIPRTSEDAVGIWRRILALQLDSIAVTIILMPFVALPTIIAMVGHTSNAESKVDQGYPFLYVFGMLFVVLFCWFLYYYLPERKGKQTMGQYIMGYRVVAAPGGKPAYALRVMFAAVGCCLWPISLFFALRNKSKFFWWDLETSTVPVRV